MKTLTPREIAILEYLLKKDAPAQSSEIASALGISVRTVQREMPYVADAIKPYGCILIRNRRQGNYLSGTPTAKERLKDDLPGSEVIDPTDKRSRRRFLLFTLLRDRQPRKLFYYSKLLGVSESTVASDIEALSGWLAKSRLEVMKKPGYGVLLCGAESDFRQGMRRFMEESIAESGVPGVYDDEVYSNVLMESSNDRIYSFLAPETIRIVRDILDAMDEPRLKALTANAYAGLVTHIAISIERIKKGGFIEMSGQELSDMESWQDYDLAERILAEMEEEFEITIPSEEIAYILLHIQGSKLAYSSLADSDASLGVEERQLMDIIDGMIDAYDSKLAPKLKSDEEFVRGLIVHLRPVIVRLKSNMSIFNPLLDDIRAEYPDIFNKSKRAAERITDATGLAINDEETGFLAMHFGAAQERLAAGGIPVRRVSIGIVCASGFGVAKLMQAKLKRELKPAASLEAFGRDELGGAESERMDFFVSTMNLDSYGVDYLQVSPLISAADLVAIEHKINDYAHIGRSPFDLDFYAHITRLETISRDVRFLIDGYRRYEVKPDITFDELLLFMAANMTGAETKGSMVAETIAEREKLYTQLFPELGFGLLHCRSEAVERVMVSSCVVFGKGIFTDPAFKGVRACVMMLSPIDESRHDHGDVLGSISAAFIDDEQFLNTVLNGGEEEIRLEIIRILKEFYYNIIDTIRIK